MSKPKCSEQVSDRNSRWPRFYPCSIPATKEHEGKWYCRIHHPDAVAKRRDEQSARWDAERRAKDAKWNAARERDRRAACFPALLAACESLAATVRRCEQEGFGISTQEAEAFAAAEAAIAAAKGEEPKPC